MSLRPRLYDCRISGLPEAIGLCSTDIARIAAAVNEAQERLINDPLAPDEGWWGGWARYAFNVTQASNTIVTPQEVARVILMDVCKQPVRIRNGFYEFLEFGRGYQPEGCNGTTQIYYNQQLAAYERETVVTATPLATAGAIIRAYPLDANDAGRACYIAGKDANGKTVFYTDGATGRAGQGERLVFASPFSDTTNTFTEITGIQKAKTFGEVEFRQVDAGGTETALVVMGPGETTAQYRKYLINGLSAYCCSSLTQQVLAMCKLDYVPAQVDTDYLCILSIPALIDECQAIRYGRMDSTAAQNLSTQKHSSALRILFGQLDHFLGKERTAIRRSLFGTDTLADQPR